MAGPLPAGGSAPAPLDASRLAELAARLRALRTRAEGALAHAKGELKGEDAALFRDLGQTGDWALAEAEFERDMADAERARTLLAAVQAAQRRMESGDYGTCEDCGADIGFERLAVSPAANRCVACQSRRERPSGPGVR